MVTKFARSITTPKPHEMAFSRHVYRSGMGAYPVIKSARVVSKFLKSKELAHGIGEVVLEKPRNRLSLPHLVNI